MTQMPADRSPILFLQTTIASSVYNIAPERSAELAAIVRSHDLALVPTDDRGFSIRVNTQSGDVTVPIAAMEYLWTCAHAFMVFYDEYGVAQRRGDEQFDIAQAPRGRDAVTLFNWAIKNLKNSGVDRWPDDLPRPEASPTPKSDVHIANEAFLSAIGWILHHEIAHKRLNHPTLTISTLLTEERRADQEATAWILDQVDNEKMRRKRTLGIVIAILAIQASELMTENHQKVDTHPKPHQRLADCLYQYTIDENDEVLAVAAANLQILLSQKEASETDLNQESFDAPVSEFLISFSRA